jgi:ribosomal-protein-alanine N-acetyltransferase
VTVHIAQLSAADLARCVELERELFPGDDPWQLSMFVAELAAGHYYRAARTADGQLVGYAGLALTSRPPGGEAEVHTIGVDPRFQRAGVGRLLLRDLLARADELTATTFLEVRTDNAAAIALYLAEGFEVVGVRRRYYQPSGADAYTMRRPAVPTGRDGSRHTPDPNAPHAGTDRATRPTQTRHTPVPNAPHAGTDRATRPTQTRHTPIPNAPHAEVERGGGAS